MSGPQTPPRAFRYYDFCLVGMVAVLLCSNLIGPAKVCAVTLPTGVPSCGLMLCGKPFGEERLLRVAGAAEAALGGGGAAEN